MLRADEDGRRSLIPFKPGIADLKDGRIVAISATQVEVVEIVPDGQGAWLERPRTIPLKEHSIVEVEQ